MKVDFVNRHVVHFGFRIREPREHLGGMFRHPRAQIRLLDHGKHIAKTPMDMAPMAVVFVACSGGVGFGSVRAVFVRMVVTVCVRMVMVRAMSVCTTVVFVRLGLACRVMNVVRHSIPYDNIEFRGGYVVALCARAFDPVSVQWQFRQFCSEVIEFQTGVEQSTHRHIAGDAGKAIEKRDSHDAPCSIRPAQKVRRQQPWVQERARSAATAKLEAPV
jgi:hypothetical protein